MKINNNSDKAASLGSAVVKKLRNINSDILLIIFTKGKLELEVKEIERVNVYNECMVIVFKDNNQQFINLLNITYIE